MSDKEMYPTRRTTESLAQRLGLPLPDRFSQDWEYEVADATKVAEWLAVYGSGQLDPSEQSLLMTMILASYNDAINDGSARPEEWELIARYLIEQKNLHAATIDYWALPDEVELENCFPITPLVRTVKMATGG